MVALPTSTRSPLLFTRPPEVKMRMDKDFRLFRLRFLQVNQGSMFGFPVTMATVHAPVALVFNGELFFALLPTSAPVLRNLLLRLSVM